MVAKSRVTGKHFIFSARQESQNRVMESDSSGVRSEGWETLETSGLLEVDLPATPGLDEAAAALPAAWLSHPGVQPGLVTDQQSVNCSLTKLACSKLHVTVDGSRTCVGRTGVKEDNPVLPQTQVKSDPVEINLPESGTGSPPPPVRSAECMAACSCTVTTVTALQQEVERGLTTASDAKYLKPDGTGLYSGADHRFLSREDAASLIPLDSRARCYHCITCPRCAQSAAMASFEEMEQYELYCKDIEYDAESKRYVADYLFKGDESREDMSGINRMGDQLEMCKKRFYQLERQAAKMAEEELREANDSILSRISAGEYATVEQLRQEYPEWDKLHAICVPLTFVYRPAKVGHTTRSCMDTSAVDNQCLDSNGKPTCINDHLIHGPSLHTDLFKTMTSVRFRRKVKYGDVGRMFNQVRLRAKSISRSRFLFREDGLLGSGPVRQYASRYLSFGYASSPIIAAIALQRCLNDWADIPELSSNGWMAPAQVRPCLLYTSPSPRDS